MSGWQYWTNVVNCLVGVERLTIQTMWRYRHRVGLGIICEPCGGRGWLVCDFCKGQKTNVKAENKKVYRRCPSCRAVPSETFVFHNLRHLELWIELSKNSILSLENLLRQCPQLSTMVLTYTSCAFGYSSHLNCDYNPKDMLDVVFQVPRLRWVEMKDFKATKNVMCVVNLLKKHGVLLGKIVAFPRFIDGKPASLPYVL